MSFDVWRWRGEFPILARTVYMISNSLGAMPADVRDSLASYADAWATRGVRAWGDRWWDMNGEVGNLVADVIGAPAGSVSMHENVTTAHAIALSYAAGAGPTAARVLARETFRPPSTCCARRRPSGSS